MPSKQAVARRVREVARRRAPRAARKAKALLRRAGVRTGPLVTVVVPVCDLEDAFLDVGLGSVCAQQHDRVEVVVVPHGQCARSIISARRHAGTDSRIRVCDHLSADLGSARNKGAALARGKYLTFMTAADTMPVAAVRLLVAALEESGSDFAVGEMSGRSGADPAVVVHRHAEERRTTIGASPQLIADTHPGNRLFRTAFWRKTALAFGGAGARGVHSPVVEAYLRSGAFDVVGEVTYRDLKRGDGTPIGHLPDPMKDLDTWLELQRDSLELLGRRATSGVRDAWLVDVLERQAVVFLGGVERADEQQWQALRQHLQQLVETGGDPVWWQLGAAARVRCCLVQDDAREQLVEMLASRRFEGGNLRTDVQHGTVLAQFPFEGDSAVEIPARCREMTLRETPLRVSLRSARWVDGHTIELELFAWISRVDGRGKLPTVEVALVSGSGDTSGPVLRLPVEQWQDHRVNAVASHRYQDYSGGAMTARVDAAELVSAALATEAAGLVPSWQLRFRVSCRGVAREGTVTEVDVRGSAAAMGTPALAPRPVGARRVVLSPDREVGIRFSTEPLHDIELVSAEVTGRRIVGELRADRPVTALRFRRLEDGLEVRCPVSGERQTFVVDLPPVGFEEGGTTHRHWQVRAVTADRQEHVVGWPDPEERWLGATEAGEVALSCSPQGTCAVSETTRTVILDEIGLEDDGVRVRAHWLGPEPADWRLELRAGRVELPVTSVSSTDQGGFEALLPTLWEEWDLPGTRVPPGQYRLAVLTGDATEPVLSVPLLSPALTRRLLDEEVGRYFRMRLNKPGREPRIILERPLLDDEREAFAQASLRAAYQEEPSHRVDPQLVYLECYGGKTATDSQLAIAEELVRTRPDLQLFWGVANFSSWVPDGVTPLLIHSREWHRVRTTARYLVNNIDFERGFHKRPGQELLQTFHGYPSKSMGIRMWEGKQLTPRRLRGELDRTSRDWDLILTPTPEMDQYYRREYAYDGTIANQGYPRDDVLVSPETEEVRRRTRERLGITGTQKVVLYAPTWRDNLAVTWRSVEIVSHLDIEAASAALGEDYVFLMRGHRFHTRASARQLGGARLVDVTSYPEVNDLILAADAAVLDYSSMRFDFALTGRPMLFLVPDLDEYTGKVRGFLYPFEDSAPGPLLETAEQVVDRLRDLDAVTEEYAEQYAAFNATYNRFQDGQSAARVAAAFFDEVNVT
ncbi:MAG: CDP-glycerol glycerophosphotransferase family protein [Marmoricola sp.]